MQLVAGMRVQKNNMSLVAFQNFFGGNRRPKQQVDSWGIVIYDLI
jgi:hypothetical protein